MNYEKAYKEALGWMRSVYPTLQGAAKEDAEHYFPELRESEDERIRREIIECIETLLKAPGASPRLCDWLAWLEKQKEETENATKTLAKILKDSAEGFRRILKKKGIDYEVSNEFWENTAVVYSKEEDVEFHKWMDDLMGPTSVEETYGYKKGLEAGMKQKEQKPIQSAEEKEFIRTIKSIIADFIRDKKPEDVSFYQKIYDWLDGRHIEQKLVEKQDYSGLNDLERSILRGFLCVGVENVPVTIIKETEKDCLAHLPVELPTEWSEEDKEMLERCIAAIPAQGDEIMPTHYLNKLRNWLESLPERLNLQPKQEWSEEDEKMRKLIIAVLQVNHPNGFFKSNELGDSYMGGVHVEKLVAWLKSLRPSWKPSDEQMKGLKFFLDFHRPQRNAGTTNWREYDAVESLYEQLKKL